MKWLICSFHINELPFKHLFPYLDGPTSKPPTFFGSIDSLTENCHKKPVVKFKAIAGQFRKICRKQLSTDQLYISRI